jgi:hypothetical protein
VPDGSRRTAIIDHHFRIACNRLRDSLFRNHKMVTDHALGVPVPFLNRTNTPGTISPLANAAGYGSLHAFSIYSSPGFRSPKRERGA